MQLFSKNSEKIAYIYPINFISPLPIVECAARIQASLDKRMGMSFAVMYGYVEKTNEGAYAFSIYQNLQNGRQTVSGNLYAKTDSSTVVDASFVQDKDNGWKFVAITIMIIISFAAAQFEGWLIATAITTLILGCFIYYSWRTKTNPPRQVTSPPASELLWYFERTLKQ